MAKVKTPVIQPQPEPKKRRIISLKLIEGRVAQNCYLGNRPIHFVQDVVVDLDEKDFLNKDGVSYLDEVVNKLTKEKEKDKSGKVANIVNIKEV